MTATAVRELIPGWREDELPLHDKLDRGLLLRAYAFGEAAHRAQASYVIRGCWISTLLLEAYGMKAYLGLLALSTCAVAGSASHPPLRSRMSRGRGGDRR